ncbi:MAG: hypothetical protein AABY15_07785, partial [Nanoarchaeota archaeon]
ILIRYGQRIPKAAYHFCRDLSNPDVKARFELFDSTGREKGLVKTASVGRGAVVAIRTNDAFQLIQEEIKCMPDFLIAVGKSKIHQ